MNTSILLCAGLYHHLYFMVSPKVLPNLTYNKFPFKGLICARYCSLRSALLHSGPSKTLPSLLPVVARLGISQAFPLGGRKLRA